MSIRALESELWWTFPGIKKQIDSLEEAEVLHIEKTPEKRSIQIMDDVYDEMRRLIVCSLKHDTKKLLWKYPMIWNYYLGKIFNKNIDVDLVILYNEWYDDLREGEPEKQWIIRKPEEKTSIATQAWDPLTNLEQLKESITHLFKLYMIDPAYLVFMPSTEFEKRTKMADKFALGVLRNSQ